MLMDYFGKDLKDSIRRRKLHYIIVGAGYLQYLVISGSLLPCIYQRSACSSVSFHQGAARP